MLSITFNTTHDPDGHGAALLLKGDWITVEVSDGRHRGRGDMSHSGDDSRCMSVASQLFARHIAGMIPGLERMKELEDGPFSTAPDFLTATAVSGLNQALYELIALRSGIPVWQLFTGRSARTDVPVYATINRALTTRSLQDYEATAARAIEYGFRRIKCAPFERVTRGGSQQVDEASAGLAVLRHLRARYPDLELSVDCHARFSPAAFISLADEFNSLDLYWIEEPCPIGPDYAEIRSRIRTRLAAGELFYGADGFTRIAGNGWAHVVMPDVKHVGGFGPLCRVSAMVGNGATEVSPHNPSGPVSTLASLHAAAACPAVTSVEIPLRSGQLPPPCSELLNDGMMRVPTGPGWGSDESPRPTER